MGDALATWFEARTCVAGSIRNMRGGGSTASALALSELCYRTLLADGAAALAGCFKQGRYPGARATGRSKHIAFWVSASNRRGWRQPMPCTTASLRLPETHPYFHGEKVAFGLLVQLVLEGVTRETVEEVLAFSTRSRLADHPGRHWAVRSYPATGLKQSPRRATAPGETIHNEPFEVTPDMVADAILGR